MLHLHLLNIYTQYILQGTAYRRNIWLFIAKISLECELHIYYIEQGIVRTVSCKL